jgi:imidazolonepropionase-like amidohydrolase
VIDVTRGTVPGEAPWALAVRPTTDVAKAVLEAKGTGASAIKIYTDLPPAELLRVTKAAHAVGLHVWSHATVFPSRPADALAAGIDVLSHASMLQWQLTKDVPPRFGPHRSVQPLPASEAASPRLAALFAEMKRRGTILDATLFVGQEQAITTTDSARRVYWQNTQAFALAATRAAHAAGVKVSAGTDDMIPEDSGPPNLPEEMRLLVSTGFTPMQALQAATRVSAEAAGVLGQVGTIEPGKRANLVVLGADPTAKIENTSNIRYVIKAGRVIVRQ